jgi:hypothetical protein
MRRACRGPGDAAGDYLVLAAVGSISKRGAFLRHGRETAICLWLQSPLPGTVS